MKFKTLLTALVTCTVLSSCCVEYIDDYTHKKDVKRYKEYATKQQKSVDPVE